MKFLTEALGAKEECMYRDKKGMYNFVVFSFGFVFTILY